MAAIKLHEKERGGGRGSDDSLKLDLTEMTSAEILKKLLAPNSGTQAGAQDTLTSEQLKPLLNCPDAVAAKIPGTEAHSKNMHAVLRAWAEFMMRETDSPPSAFIPLTCAEWRWPGLHRLFFFFDGFLRLPAASGHGLVGPARRACGSA